MMVTTFLVIVLALWVMSPTTREVAKPGVYAFFASAVFCFLIYLYAKFMGHI